MLAADEPVRNVVLRYFHALDRRDYDMVSDCFDENVTATYGGEAMPSGAAALTDELRKRMDRLGVTMHFAGNLLVSIEEDGATAETYAIAFVSDAGAQGAARMRVRGLRYHDRLVLTAAGWKISERVHSVRWSFETDGQVFPN
ncbi:MAG TPA: nuclear transport factor 2 family protein [Acetobacteraceae bacterium]|nr:nuclear transport factor 2 family protein [Acetobacteraceae bacterium]